MQVGHYDFWRSRTGDLKVAVWIQSQAMDPEYVQFVDAHLLTVVGCSFEVTTASERYKSAKFLLDTKQFSKLRNQDNGMHLAVQVRFFYQYLGMLLSPEYLSNYIMTFWLKLLQANHCGQKGFHSVSTVVPGAPIRLDSISTRFWYTHLQCTFFPVEVDALLPLFFFIRDNNSVLPSEPYCLLKRACFSYINSVWEHVLMVQIFGLVFISETPHARKANFNSMRCCLLKMHWTLSMLVFLHMIFLMWVPADWC